MLSCSDLEEKEKSLVTIGVIYHTEDSQESLLAASTDSDDDWNLLNIYMRNNLLSQLNISDYEAQFLSITDHQKRQVGKSREAANSSDLGTDDHRQHIVEGHYSLNNSEQHMKYSEMGAMTARSKEWQLMFLVSLYSIIRPKELQLLHLVSASSCT